MRSFDLTLVGRALSAAVGLTGMGMILTSASAPAIGTAAMAQAPAPTLQQQPLMLPKPIYLWSAQMLSELRAEINASAGEGLDPLVYSANLPASEGTETDRLATAAALSLARDYARGRTDDPSRFGWHIERPNPSMDRLSSELRNAIGSGQLRTWLRSHLPTDPRYAALRTAYAAETDAGTRDRLRANMERWRWMPRQLGADHIYVNVPSYTLSVVDDGKPVSSYTVVVGKPSTPTPQIAVPARSVVVNPWWNVPRSIAAKMSVNGAKGYEAVKGGGIRQRPGPGNALGKVKIDMPNPHAIYLHDTPSKSLFAEKSRTFSHGCIRVKDIDRLAAELMELDRGDASEVKRALAGSSTRTVALQRTRPVYLVYFTMDVGADGRIVTLEDPYRRDTRLVASLDKSSIRYAARDSKTAKTNA